MSTISNSYLKKIIDRIRENIRFLKAIKSEDFYWAYFLVSKRLKYKFNALKNGLEINKCDPENLYNFRRNIHRIEKGLSYQKIKPIFAEDYILETVKYLEYNKQHNFLDLNTQIWGKAVLDLYFKTCSHSKVILKANEIYQSLEINSKEPSQIPYLCSERPDLDIDYSSLYNLALRRRSVRFYLNKLVEPELIEKALTLGLQSPSACNRQSFKYLFFNEKEIVDKISQVPGGVAGYTLPSIVVLIGSYKGYFDERDINAPIIDASLSAMAFLFALETLGLSSVCINWPNLIDREEKIRKLIHLEKHEFIIMLIGVGYPEPGGKIPYSAKQEIHEILSVNERLLEN